MDSKFIPSDHEEKIYHFWEKKEYFRAKINHSRTPFSIILPPPNANADLHMGHVLYVYEDIMIRFHKLKGKEVCWIPGADHAGFETQYVFEKHLQKEGKSRFDFNPNELYNMIWDFVIKNREVMEQQLRRLGFALDWSKKKFTLDEDIVDIVRHTFKRLYDDGLIKRKVRLVNYCIKCGTGFSDLEVNYIERIDPLFYLKYGPFVVATTRPETKFGDTAVAFYPGDTRYIQYEGQEFEIEGVNGVFKVKVISDKAVDPEFGTGIEKVTPAHDFLDFEIGKRHQLPLKQVIDFRGRLMEAAGKFQGMQIGKAREAIVDAMKQKGLIEKIDEKYVHRVGVCYKCGTTIEPLPLSQWFVEVKPLVEKALSHIKKKYITFIPKRFTKRAMVWLSDFHDWNISRQIVWGIRIPAWRCEDCSSVDNEKWIVTDGSIPEHCVHCKGKKLSQDTDTFDTWFSSAQWPFATLKSHGDDFFDYFYPTSVMETGYDILPWWVCRMIMMGIYATKKPPFQTVFLHGMVRDSKGQKMSKSRGNVINPMKMVDLYGADALRAAFVFQSTEGGDFIFSEDKIRGMRNFANKIWNMGRFIHLHQIKSQKSKVENTNEKLQVKNHHVQLKTKKSQCIQALEKEFKVMKRQYYLAMEKYQFSQAFGLLYEFSWHRFADYYLEALKNEAQSGNIEVMKVLQGVYTDIVMHTHPFMPFVTEAVWKELEGEESSILERKF